MQTKTSFSSWNTSICTYKVQLKARDPSPPLRKSDINMLSRVAAVVSLLWGDITAAWRPNILCFAVLTTRERDITQLPQSEHRFLCVSVRTFWLRDFWKTATYFYVCIYVWLCLYVCVPVGSNGVNPQIPVYWWGLILSFTLSLFSVVSVLFSGFVMTKMYICLLHIMYVSEVQNI